MRYIGKDPVYAAAERARAQGEVAKALALQEKFLGEHPGSLGSRFVTGLLAYQLNDFKKADAAYTAIEEYAPREFAVLYNHALALMALGRYADSALRLRSVVLNDPKNYAALLNLYLSYRKGGDLPNARATLMLMKREFPKDAEVKRLLSL
jgi:tetratricopeptide (TPR) repeat protein